MDENEKQYTYIVQASLEPSKCKIGKTNDLDIHLKEYNNVPKENIYQYLFTCEVANMAVVENDIKENFGYLREVKTKEIYFYNPDLLDRYVKFIKSHPLFEEEIFIKEDEKKEIVKIVRKFSPSLKERGLTTVDVINKAKKTKNDEFYTRYEDIEKEILMYDKDTWKDKCVFCNCDDAVDNDERKSSAFSLFFIKNFKELGLKKLICTHYGGGLDLVNQGAKGYIFTYIFTKKGFKALKEYPKGYTGSFDDPLSLKILNEEADIVCTNPPFSKTIEYWKIVVESGKKFLIISNIANVVTTAYIPFFRNNQVWAGYSEVDDFLNFKRQITRAAGYWYTNIPIKDRPKYKQLKIVSLKDIPEKYKKYDDNGMLIVDNCYIPNNYNLPFAVSARPILNGLLEKGYHLISDNVYHPYLGGEMKFARVLVQKI
ncbi:MAG: adenine-specific methyltransferase EcoRI family protein [Ignavibacteria bacterium]|jgi:hypothetical protein|nr:adenine-specific methyltransferase EcoRI family protein [Ignavibacteria bacterium]